MKQFMKEINETNKKKDDIINEKELRELIKKNPHLTNASLPHRLLERKYYNDDNYFNNNSFSSYRGIRLP